MRHDSADFLTLLVLFALVNESSARASLGTLELIPRGCCSQKTLSRERERNATHIRGYPSTAPMFGYVCGRPTSASWVQHQVSRVRGHEDTSLHCFGNRLHSVDFVRRSGHVRPHVAKREER